MVTENTENNDDVLSKYDSTIIGISFFSIFLSFSTLTCFNSILLPFFIIGCIDMYFIFVIFYAALKSDSHKDDHWFCTNAIPNRFAGVFIFAFLYLSIIFCFAAIFKILNFEDYNTIGKAIYKGVISITSFSYDDYTNYCWKIKSIQIFQSFNGILLLTATFGFLISRISSFRDKHTVNDLYTLVSGKIVDASKIENIEKDIEEIKTTNKSLNNTIAQIKSSVDEIKLK